MIEEYRYGSRAMLQDADLAMGGDLVLGIVELELNSFDSYQRLRESGKLAANKKARITVRVNSRTRDIAVRDRGDGFGKKEVDEGLRQLGGRTSGTLEGASVRGNRGRGLRDLVTFGPVRVRSIRKGLLADVRLTARGIEPSYRPATKADYEELGVRQGESGAEVSLRVGKHVTLPRAQTLGRKLTQHFELRDLCSRDDYEVVLIDEVAEERQTLRYEPPATSEVLFAGEVEVEGYEGKAELRLERLVERCERGRNDYERTCGVLIKGAVTTYESTLGKFEGSPWGGYVRGELRFPRIDELIAEYDEHIEREETPPASNPTQILTRNRTGLHPAHPATKAIHAAIEEELDKALKRIAKEMREEKQTETDVSTQRQLSQLARLLAEERRKIEQEEELEVEEDVIGPVLNFTVIPPILRRPVDGGAFNVSVRAPRNNGFENEEVRLQIVPDGVVELRTETPLKLTPSVRRSDVVTATIVLSPVNQGECRVMAAAAGHNAVAAIDITPPRPLYLPESLEFDNRGYTARVGRNKSVKVLIPKELLDDDRTVAVTSSDPNVVSVLKGGRAKLTAADEAAFASADFQVRGRVVGKSATLTASYGSSTATARVLVKEQEELLTVPDIRLVTDEPTLYPALLFDESGRRKLIKVYIRHPILAPYFDRHETVLTLNEISSAVVADVLADYFARDLTSRKLDPMRADPEVDDVYVEHYRVKQRMVKVAQACIFSAKIEAERESAVAIS
jgi:hypothetical protein